MGRIPKVVEQATCPYCGDKDYHTFYVNADTLFCNKCRYEFEIELDVEVKVKSMKMDNPYRLDEEDLYG